MKNDEELIVVEPTEKALVTDREPWLCIVAGVCRTWNTWLVVECGYCGAPRPHNNFAKAHLGEVGTEGEEEYK